KHDFKMLERSCIITRMDYRNDLKIQKVISNFIAASSGIEKYLQRRGPLTATQWKSISLAVSLMQFYVDRSVERPGARPKSFGANASSAAAVLGKLGGLKGGKARARKLSTRRRVAIAKLAALSRWGKRP